MKLKIKAILGDITKQNDVDAIVNAANEGTVVSDGSLFQNQRIDRKDA